MKNPRNTELLLLLAALPILVILFGMYLLNSTTNITWASFAVPLGLFLAFLIAHIIVRKCAPHADPAILPITFLLSGIGIVFVMRLAPDLALRQLIWLFVGIAALIVTLALVKSIESIARYKYTIMLIGVILMLLPALIGTEINGSRIWLVVGGFSFQPGEIAKILVVLFLASYLAENRELLSVSTWKLGPLRLPDPKTLFPLLLMWVLSLLIMVFERDLGSAALFFIIFLIMLYLASGRWSYVILGICLLAIGAIGSYYAFDHVRARIDIWLNPFAYAQTTGYQIVQALYSMADGGLFGSGIGRGLATEIPVVESDFIFAAIAEEMGLLGAAGVLILYILFIVRGFLAAARAKSDVAAFTAVGLTSSISFQAFIIVGGVIGLIPLTGLTLPFMSQGGSSLLASFIITALLLRASDEGTGIETEMNGVADLEGGILGRYALGKRISLVTVVFTLLFAVLIGRLTYIQVVKADYYQNLSSNNHTIAKAARNQRGSIITADGKVLAESKLGDDGLTYVRSYPLGTVAAHAVGYYSTQYGMTGVEATENDYLTGSTGYASWSDAIQKLAGTASHGDNVVLTINSTVQEAAETQLVGCTGACVAIDPTTGAVLAMASSPTYDPNDVEAAVNSTDDVLYNRATSALYAPGSSFKMLTLAAAFEENIATKDTTYDAPASLEIGGGVVTNYGNENYGTITLQQATDVSSNTAFAQVADSLESVRLVEYAERFGFDDNSLSQDFDMATSLMPDASQMTEWETAWAGCGQPVGSHSSAAGPQASVMQMALVGSALANGGVLMKPYIVGSIQDEAGATVTTTTPKQYGRAISAETASKVMDVLETTVTSGSGSGAAVSGATVAGKTGTAQTGKEVDDAWFVGMAEAGGKKVCVAIVIEQGGTGGAIAAPKAAAVMEAALKAEGVL